METAASVLRPIFASIARSTYSPASRFWANEQAIVAAIRGKYPATDIDYVREFAYNWMRANAPD